MGGWKLYLVLLLPLTVCEDGGETFQKTLGKEADVTPICTNETIIMLIVCKIRTETSRGEECHLLYRYEHGFENKCDSGFKLMMKNQTVFLHLINLTPADSGNYSCECSQLSGTYTVHLNVTVEVKEEAGRSRVSSVLLPLISVIIIVGVYLRFFHRRINPRLWCEASGLSAHEAPGSLDEDEPDDTYTSLQQTEADIYHTVSSDQHRHDNKTHSARNLMAVHWENQEPDGDDQIYENIQTSRNLEEAS